MNSKATAAALTLAIPLAAVAQTSVEDQQSKIEKALDNVLSKQGLSIGGVATGEYLYSSLSGSALKDSLRSTEPVTYTQVDFDLRARPNATTTARGVFRMHLDWPSFFGAPSTPIETRWLSLDGKAAGMVYYGVGDMGVRWSPYTMWAPDVGFLYTPRLFQQAQQQAMDERFQGDNKRNLQGVQLGLRAAVPLVSIDSFDVGLLGAKLATADHKTSEQLKAAYPFNWGAFDRYVIAGHGDVSFLRGASLGMTFISQMDLKSSFASQDTTYRARWGRDSAQSGSIFAMRGAFQADKVAELNGIKGGLNLEFAHSSWDAFSRTHGPSTAPIGDTTPQLSGNAIDFNVNAGYVVPKTVDIRLTAGYLMNDSAFRNDLAQSPTFHGGRILNTEQGWDTWNTFDAMYHNVYRFVPEANTGNTAKNAVEKNNYVNQVLDPTQYSLSQLDWNLQMVLPGGLATANRVGPKIDLNTSVLEGALDIKAAFYSFEEAKGSYYDASGSAIKAKYQKIQAGAKVRVDKFLNGAWDLPLEFAGSYEQNTGKADGSELNYESNVTNLGAYIGLHKRVALLVGYQAIDGKQKTGIADSTVALAGFPVSNKQTNLGLGAEFKIQEGAYLIGMWNKLTTKYTDLKDQDFDQDIVNVKLQMAF